MLVSVRFSLVEHSSIMYQSSTFWWLHITIELPLLRVFTPAIDQTSHQFSKIDHCIVEAKTGQHCRRGRRGEHTSSCDKRFNAHFSSSRAEHKISSRSVLSDLSKSVLSKIPNASREDECFGSMSILTHGVQVSDAETSAEMTDQVASSG